MLKVDVSLKDIELAQSYSHLITHIQFRCGIEAALNEGLVDTAPVLGLFDTGDDGVEVLSNLAIQNGRYDHFLSLIHI